MSETLTKPGEISRETSLALYELQYRLRVFEKRAYDLFLQNLVKGTSHLALGQEAVAAGFAVAMRKTDWSFCTYRGHDHTIARGVSMAGCMAELLGRANGVLGGKGGSMHLGEADKYAMGSYAIMAALYRKNAEPDFRGEWIDLALFDGLFRLIEWQIIFYDQLGEVPTRVGNKLAAAPAAVINTYKTSDDRWLTVTSGTPRSVSNVAALVGEPAEDYATRPDQARNAVRLDRLAGEWIAQRPLAECVEVMQKLEVVASPIYTVEDILADETYRERENIVTVDDPDLGKVRMQNVIPKLANYPGSVWRTAPALGQDNDLVYKDFLGKSEADVDQLRQGGHI